MNRLLFAPVIVALLALAGCGGKNADGGSATKAEAVASVAPPAGTKWSDKIVATDEGVRMGNPDAPIKLIEYGSYTCPHCREFMAEAHDPLINDYVDSGKVSYEYRNLIRDPVDATVALLAHCEGPQPYFALTTQLFEHQNAMIDKIRSQPDSAYKNAVGAPADKRFYELAKLAGLIEWGKQHGIPEEKAKKCLADSAMVKKLADITQESASKWNIQGTPSFIMNGILLENTAAWPTLKAKLADAGA